MIIKNEFSKTRIIFGNDKRLYLSKLIKKKNILIVCSKRGKKKIILDKKLSFIKNNRVFWIDDVISNPTVGYFEKKNKYLKNFFFDYIVAIGGGSVIYTAKIIFLFFSLKKKTKIKNIIDNANNLKINISCKLVVLPTISGSGSEVTPYATIWDKKNKRKFSINHDSLYPTLSIIDPVLTFGLPKEETINSGLDCLNQAFESIWNKNFNKNILPYAFKSIKFTLKALDVLNININHSKSRADLAKASLYSGLCISQTKTNICHSISYPLTLCFGTPHGLACAFTMLSIINLINNKKKFFFLKLAKYLGFASGVILEKNIKVLFAKLKVKEKNKFYIKNKKRLFFLKKYMKTQGRYENFIFKVNSNLLVHILNKSYL